MIQQTRRMQFSLVPALAALVAALVATLVAGPAGAQPAPVPPPLQQAGVDCARPQYASDTLVCSDPALRALDGTVAGLAQALPPRAESPLWEDQYGWIRRRSRCAFERDHRACLAAAYADRLAVLTAATATASQRLACDGPWRGLALVANDGPALAIRGDDQLLAVATPAAAGWQPWLSLKQNGGRIILQPRNGAAIRCRSR